jgi:uncharacterized protein (DUF427 family)
VTDAVVAKSTEGVQQAASPPVRFESSPRRVRTMLGGVFVADSSRVMLMWEPPRAVPVYYFPVDDVRTELLVESAHTRSSPTMGEARYWTIRVGESVAQNAAWSYTSPPVATPEVSGYIAFKWDQMDAWFEEDDEVFVHPRDPYKRVDVLNSSRHVRVVVGGETLADTHSPRLLFETGLPTRYYIPKVDVRLDLLTPTDSHTACPYKGIASYWTADIGDQEFKDIAWSYPAPIPECAKIENLVSFYNERVDAIYVDGELQPVPRTGWSRPANK